MSPDDAEPRGLQRIFAPLRRSARLRLALAFVVLLLIGSVAAILAVRALLHDQLDARISFALDQEIDEFDRLRDSIDGEDEGGGIEIDDDIRILFDTFVTIDPPPEGEQILTLVEGDVHRVEGVQHTGYDLGADQGFIRLIRSVQGRADGLLETPAGPVRYAARSVVVDGEEGHFVVAAFIAQDQREIESIIRVSTAVILSFLLLGAVFAYLLAGRVFAPLKRLTGTARRISETDLSQRIEVTGTDEISELGHTFNDMLDRLDRAFTAQRQLLRDVGHELRTPLAIASGHLEFVPSTADSTEALAVVRDEHARMRRLIDDLLVLARAEPHDFLQFETVDLAPLILELQDKARHLADRDWQVVTDEAGKVVTDSQRITQAMINLIDNAVKHTLLGDRIEIGARCSHGNATLWVGDSGPGVADEEREKIFTSFTRGRDARPGTGTGLGLAIVKRIAEAHGGNVTVGTSSLGGARFTMTLPIDQPESTEEP